MTIGKNYQFGISPVNVSYEEGLLITLEITRSVK